MDPQLIDSLSNEQLSRLLKLDDTGAWDATDAAIFLRHQLSAPILKDLASVPVLAGSIETLRRLMVLKRTPVDQSFLDQLLSPAPLLELLTATKQFARHLRDDPMNPLRGTPATVIYYAAIAAALVHASERISQLPDLVLSERFRWAGRQKGAESLTSLCDDAASRVAINSAQDPKRSPDL